MKIKIEDIIYEYTDDKWAATEERGDEAVRVLLNLSVVNIETPRDCSPNWEAEVLQAAEGAFPELEVVDGPPVFEYVPGTIY